MTTPDLPVPYRPTMYKGIAMRSRLEATWAAYWDEEKQSARENGWSLEWRYEPMCYANAKGQYLPDFELDWRPELPLTFLEVKPVLTDPIPLMERMEIILDSCPTAELQIAVGQPRSETRYLCTRTDFFQWYHWQPFPPSGDTPRHLFPQVVEMLGARMGIIREVPEPEWFDGFRTDPRAVEAHQEEDWERLFWLEREIGNYA